MPVPSSARRTLRPVALLAAALLATGCDLTTVNDDPVLDVSFFLQEQQPPVIQPPTVGVEGGLRYLTVRGTFVAQCSNVRRSARHTIDGTVINIRVIYAPATATCASEDPLGTHYVANLVGLAGGTYDVRVVHEGDLGVPTGTEVLRQNVTITSTVGG